MYTLAAERTGSMGGDIRSVVHSAEDGKPCFMSYMLLFPWGVLYICKGQRKGERGMLSLSLEQGDDRRSEILTSERVLRI